MIRSLIHSFLHTLMSFHFFFLIPSEKTIFGLEFSTRIHRTPARVTQAMLGRRPVPLWTRSGPAGSLASRKIRRTASASPCSRTSLGGAPISVMSSGHFCVAENWRVSEHLPVTGECLPVLGVFLKLVSDFLCLMSFFLLLEFPRVW